MESKMQTLIPANINEFTVPGLPAAIGCPFLMDAVRKPTCDHQKVSKNLACRRQFFGLAQACMCLKTNLISHGSCDRQKRYRYIRADRDAQKPTREQPVMTDGSTKSLVQ